MDISQRQDLEYYRKCPPFIGLSVRDAIRLAIKHGFQYRISIPYAKYPNEFIYSRVNLEVHEGIVIDYMFF